MSKVNSQQSAMSFDENCDGILEEVKKNLINESESIETNISDDDDVITYSSNEVFDEMTHGDQAGYVVLFLCCKQLKSDDFLRWAWLQ